MCSGQKARALGAVNRAAALALALACALSACGGKSSAPAGARTLTLLAGALGGPRNEDGIGAAARFQALSAVVSEDPNTVYVADNGVIRRLDVPSRAVTTLWHEDLDQGPPSGAPAGRFAGAQGLASDGAGYLYFADATNQNIHQVELANGTVTTIAGAAGLAGTSDGVGAAARFHTPVDIACDRAGSLFVSDDDNDTVRQIDLTTGAVTTLAGSPAATQALDGIGAAALIPHPTALTLDGRGNLYVEDDSGIRKVVIATAEVSTVSKWSQWTHDIAFVFSLPTTLASDTANGALYYADLGGGRVAQVALATGVPTLLAGRTDVPFLSYGFRFADGVGDAAQFSGPSAISADNQGQLYVADGTCTVRRIDETSAAVSTLAGLPPAYGPTDGTATDARFTGPQGLASDAQGNLFVADQADDTIRRIAAETGEVTTIAGSAYLNGTDDGVGSAARFYAPSALALDRAGDLYVADYSNGEIRKINLATAAISTVVARPQSSDPNGLQLEAPSYLALDGAGNLYVVDDNSALYKVVLATGALSVFAGGPQMYGSADGALADARFYIPHGIASDGASTLYIADTINDTIRKIDLDTEQVTTIAGSPQESGTEDGVGAAARFERPTDLAYDGHGALYVTDKPSSTIRRLVLATGRVTTVVGTALQTQVRLGALPGGLNMPTGLAVLPSGDLAISCEQALLLARF